MGASLVHGATVLRTAEGRGPSQLCMRRVLPPQPMAFENCFQRLLCAVQYLHLERALR